MGRLYGQCVIAFYEEEGWAMPLLIINDVPIECINRAAIAYHVPAPLIISVLKTENGRVGMANKNINGSYDFGPMQINSLWLPKIAPYGFTAHDLQYDACKNVEVGAWILSQNLNESGSWWQNVGDYHSHTLALNQAYSQKVYGKYAVLQQAINSMGKHTLQDD
jgi:hypothetical protein